jgi:hypothetical protein
MRLQPKMIQGCKISGFRGKATLPILDGLSVDSLVRKGYFPTELPPPFSTDTLADALSVLPALDTFPTKWSKTMLFSIPKSWPARRTLAVPNPLHQIQLSDLVSRYWRSLQGIFKTSQICLSTPTVIPGGRRAVSRLVDFEQWSIERFQRSADARFVLRTDFSRYYHTIYTHSLPWAMHGKDAAKADRTFNIWK